MAKKTAKKVTVKKKASKKKAVRKKTAKKKKTARTYPLGQLYFYLTEGCNMRCRHCWLAPKYEADSKHLSNESLDFELFKDIVKQGKKLGMRGVKLTGGEPLMHPDIEKLIKHVQKEKLRLTIESNGVLATPKLAKLIAGGKNAFISVSIDGANAKTHEWVRGVKGSFKEATRGIRNLAKAGLHPQVILSVMRKTRPQMERVVKMAIEMGAGSVKFNVVMPTERGVTMRDSGETLSMKELIETGAWVENVLIPKYKGFRIFYHHPASFRPLNRMFSRSGDGCGCCGIFGILGVLANGDYALCGIGESVPDLNFGNARTVKLATIWKENKVLKDIRKNLPKKLEGICGECIMKRVCLGSCVAQNYYTYKNLYAPFWYCDEADKLGLFPASRKRPKVIKKKRKQ